MTSLINPNSLSLFQHLGKREEVGVARATTPLQVAPPMLLLQFQHINDGLLWIQKKSRRPFGNPFSLRIMWSIWSLEIVFFFLKCKKVFWTESIESVSARVASWVIASKGITEQSVQDFTHCIERVRNLKSKEMQRTLLG